MNSKNNDQFFTITTLGGMRYQTTFNQVLSWIKGWYFSVFLIISLSLLICFAPHNAVYGLTFPQRFIFWPIVTIGFLIIFFGLIGLGSHYARSKPGRHYYSPIGLIVATTISTFGGSYLVSALTGNPPDISIWKGMEVLFNILLACLFEAIFFYLSIKRSKKIEKQKRNHQWEDI